MKTYEKPEMDYIAFEVESITDVSQGTGDGSEGSVVG